MVERELASHVTKLRRSPEYATLLKEAEARRLFALAQDHEQNARLCCAHEVYREAARLTPAETAEEAAKRLEVLARDPMLIATIAACQKLQQCQAKFQLAETLDEVFPAEAAAHYRWITENAPRDSRVYLAAVERLNAPAIR